MIKLDNIDQMHSLGLELQKRAEEAAGAMITKDKSVPLGASIAQMSTGHIVVGRGENDCAPGAVVDLTVITPEGGVQE